jgi:hypothetical protein
MIRKLVVPALLLGCGGKGAAPEFGTGSRPETVVIEQPIFSPAPTPLASNAPSSAGAEKAAPPVCPAICRSQLPAAALRALTARAKSSRKCYERELAAGDPKLSVRMSVFVRLSSSGMPCEARVVKTDNENVSDCVVAFFKEPAFPPLDEGCADVNVPIAFVPSK